MVQQVQQGVINTPETTLETIEAVGTSSKKLIAGRQTTGEHFVGGCTATGSSSWGYDYHTGNRGSGVMQMTNLSIGTTRGPSTFSKVDYGIRVPKGGTYKLEMIWRGGFDEMKATIYVKKGASFSDETIYTESTYENSNITVSKVFTVGKFEIITVRVEFYYYGSSSFASTNINISSLSLIEL